MAETEFCHKWQVLSDRHLYVDIGIQLPVITLCKGCSECYFTIESLGAKLVVKLDITHAVMFRQVCDNLVNQHFLYNRNSSLRVPLSNLNICICFYLKFYKFS